MKIRQVDAAERGEVCEPIQAYAFMGSPVPPDTPDRQRDRQRFHADEVTLVAEEDGTGVAVANAIPMRQNLRGRVYPMAGVAGVATLPLARRRGHVRALVMELLGRMRDAGHVVSALYPFRPSFYGRFGYVGLPQTRTVRFAPASAAEYLRADLPGEVRWGTVADYCDAYQQLTGELLAREHGFAVLPDSRTAQLREVTERWLATAWVDGTVAAAVSYRIDAYGGDLVTGDLLAASPLGRALLLRFFASHTDQVEQVHLTVPPAELPELWGTDFAAVTEVRTAIPQSPSPMARVLSVAGLAGMPVGGAVVTIEVAGDPFAAGRYTLDGSAGELAVQRGGDPAATLTVAGLSALVFGVLDPDELPLRGFGQVGRDAAAPLRTLFPRAVPYLNARF